jgi:hypothetical protein
VPEIPNLTDNPGICLERMGKNHGRPMRFQVLMAENVKIRAFWDVAPCSLGVDRYFRGAYYLHNQGATFQKSLSSRKACQDSRCTGRNLSPGPFEFEAGHNVH